jgi:hypothetical protein
LDCRRTRYYRKDQRAGNALLAQISVDFKVENDYSIAANELCKSISKIEILTVELWTSTLKKPNAIVQPFCGRHRR